MAILMVCDTVTG